MKSTLIIAILLVLLSITGPLAYGQGRGRGHDRNRNEPPRTTPQRRDDRRRGVYYPLPPVRVIIPPPGHRHVYRRYPRRYGPSVVIVLGRIPVVISQYPVYRDCRYVYRRVINLSNREALIRINNVPYQLDGREYLYPGESIRIPVPLDAPYDIDAAVLINGGWYQVDVEAGYGSDLIIPFVG